MGLLDKIGKLILDTTVTADVAQNKAKGSVDVIGGSPVKRSGISTIGYQCPKGQVWDKKTRTCMPKKNESIVVGAPYSSGNSTIAGSGQTRAVGRKVDDIIALMTKEPVNIDGIDDKTIENIGGRPNLKFDSLLGGYVVKGKSNMETEDE